MADPLGTNPLTKANRPDTAPLTPSLDWLQIQHSEISPEIGPTLPVERTALAGSTEETPQLPHYKILDELGRGGMSVVYLAEDQRLQRQVAIKVLMDRQLARRDDLARFEAEARTLARLQHPNIVQVYEIGTHQGLLYCVLEYASGGSLDWYLRGRPQLPRLAAQVAVVLADAMQAAHEQGIIHRDLKPSNVLVAKKTSESASVIPATSSRSLDRIALPEGLKISDFGLAKQMDRASDLTKTGMIIGTPNYMSPEQAAGRHDLTDHLCDVYALGAILYEMLTGRPPFVGPTAVETIMLVQTTDPLPPRTLQPKVPRDLETICLKALRKVPAERYASAADLAADLRRWLEGRPILARPTSRWERFVRWCRRNPAVAGLSATLLVTLLVALAVVTVLYLLADQRRQVAEKAQAEAVQARDVAEKAQERERSNAERLEAFRTFLQDDFFSQVDSRQLGPEAKMRDALLRAIERIGPRFVNQPELEAYVRDQIGYRLFAMSLYREAQAQQRRAWELYQKVLGPDHSDTLHIRRNLADTLTALGEYDEAEQLLRAVLTDWERLQGAEGLQTTKTLASLAKLVQKRGRPAEAETLYHRAWQNMAKLKGEKDEFTLILQNNLANVQASLSKFADAERHLRQALAGFRAMESVKKETGDLYVAGISMNLAMLLLHLGRAEEALPILEDAVRIYRAKEGERSAATLTVMEGYAGCLQALKRWDDAEQVLKTVLAHRLDLFGPSHIDVWRTRHNLAGVLEARGLLSEAEQEMRTVLAESRKKLGPTHIEVLDSEYLLACLLVRRKLRAEAESLFADLMPRLETALGKSHVYYVNTVLNRANCLIELRRPATAEQLLRELIQQFDGEPPSAPFYLHRARSLLGKALLDQNQLTQAEAFVLPSAQALWADEKAPIDYRKEAVDFAIEWCERRGDLDQANSWKKHRQTLTTQKTSPSPP